MTEIITPIRRASQSLFARNRALKSLSRRKRWLYAISAVLIGLFALFVLISRLPKPLFPDDYSTVVTDKNGKLLRVYLNSGQQWIFPPDSFTIPPQLETCILLFEDKRFYSHFGIDPLALARAVGQNIKHRRFVSGASTITMQLARLSGNRSRTLPNKIIEASQAIRIELRYSKQDILRLYVQHAPYGGNIVGIEAAARRYYNKSPHQLTWSEAATLAILPNSPSLINPVHGREKLKQRRNTLLDRLYENGIIDEETLMLSKLEDIPDSQLPFSFNAPHLCNRIHRSHRGQTVRTTIDRAIQRDVNNITNDYSQRLQKFGIDNIAAIVIDNKTQKVRAYIGSNDYFDRDAGGMVDGVMAHRSYGSLLKPFLYARAIDEGIIVPETMLKDIPTYYGAFSPFNADREYRGLVSSREALIHSLNVPAVRLLYTVGYPSFYDFLTKAGMTTLTEPSTHYGLTLILGGAEASLFELARLFSGLANMGEFRDITIYEDDTITAGTRLLSPGATHLIIECMKELYRPGAEHYWNQYSGQWPIAWKTGTSYGHRDAWAIGTTPQWTIGVWVGNFSGVGNPAIFGAMSAGPVMFRIFNALPKDPYNAWFDISAQELADIAICAQTGYAVGAYCPDTVMAKTSAGSSVKPLARCPYHTEIFVATEPDDAPPRERVCSLCWEVGKYHKENWLLYPPAVVQFMKKHGHTYKMLPPHRRSCPAHHAAAPLEFVYPVDGMVVLVPRDVDGTLQDIIAKAAHNTADSEIYWYLNDTFIGSTIEGSHIQPHTIAITLTTGTHRLTITDTDGNTQSISFTAQRRG